MNIKMVNGELVEKDELNKFIYNVWNYYNGKINVIIPARLEIDYSYDKSSTMVGIQYYPDLVIIYPMQMIKIFHNNTHLLLQGIIETIIHELYHVDQFKLESQITNPEYVNTIERQVQFQTNCYIMNNMRDIYDTFSVVMDYDYYKYSLSIYSKCYVPAYRRVHLIEHYALFIDYVIKEMNPFLDYMIDVYNETNADISFIINNQEVPIRANGELIDIALFNSTINALWFEDMDDDSFGPSDVALNLENNKLSVKINRTL